MALNLFPVRVPIGKAAAPDGRQLDVLMTPEFARALTDLLERIGGPNGVSTTELARLIKALQAQAVTLIEQITDLFDKAQELARQIEEQTVILAVQPEPSPDRDHSEEAALWCSPRGDNDDQIAELAVQIAASRDTSDRTQQLSDLALLSTMQVTRPAIRRNTVTGARAPIPVSEGDLRSSSLSQPGEVATK